MATSITPAALLAAAANPPSNDAEKKALHDAAKQLVFATESPSDTETRTMTAFTLLPLIQIATDLDLFNLLATTSPSGGKGWHISELAKKTGGDPALLHRVLRFLATQDLIAEVDAATYGPSHLTPFLQPSGFKAGVTHHASWVAPCLTSLPLWLKKNSYRSPTGSSDCAFQEAIGTDLDAMSYLGAHPEQAAATFEYMAWQKVRNRDWMDGSVKVAEEFRISPEAAGEGRALLVDVGGGGGHQCFAFRQAFPEREGRLVVQDVEMMVGLIDKDAAARAGVEPMAHDFYTPQPVKGAKVYYMRTVLHDWDDEKAVKILTQLREAMAGDSLVVIDEIVVPHKGASEKMVLYDMVMLAALGAKERSEEQWRSVLERAGLRLRDISIYDEELGTGLVVAVKA